MSISDLMHAAAAARKKGAYPEAERILSDALRQTLEPEPREELLRQLFYLYFAPVYENLTNAEVCLEEIEKLNSSALNGMEWTLFMLNCKRDPNEARKWAEITIKRAESENWVQMNYSATAVAGLLAAQRVDLPTVRKTLAKLRSLIEKDEQLPLGDAIPFLETSIGLSDDVNESSSQLAQRIASSIEDPEFRARAYKLAKSA
jgi:hypothetical protein